MISKEKTTSIKDQSPWRLVLLGIGLIIIGLHFSLRDNGRVMTAVYEGFVRPVHSFLARLCDGVRFSVAECIIGLFAMGIIVYIIYEIIMLCIKGRKGRRVYITVLTLVTAAVLVYAGQCVFWGTYYYAPDFVEKSGVSEEPISLEELTVVTAYFADLANEYGQLVPRDENGVYAGDRDALMAKSGEIYENITGKFPCLAGENHRPKPIYFSRVMSYTGFTGFFFPFTAEANLNMDSPAAYLPSTIAHELAHQRGVSPEQQANFVAVAACLDYGDTDFVYSAALLAYIHLGNALYSVDYEAWKEIYQSLDAGVLADFADNNAYWAQFEDSLSQKVSDAVYDGFLKSYDQELGLKSYGACVDLLVNYYYEDAKTAAQ